MEANRATMDRTFRRVALTSQQSRILARIASGFSQAQIAEEEYTSLRQIERVVEDAKERLGANNLVQAAMLACFWGHITLPDEDGMVYSRSMMDRLEGKS